MAAETRETGPIVARDVAVFGGAWVDGGSRVYRFGSRVATLGGGGNARSVFDGVIGVGQKGGAKGLARKACLPTLESHAASLTAILILLLN